MTTCHNKFQHDVAFYYSIDIHQQLCKDVMLNTPTYSIHTGFSIENSSGGRTIIASPTARPFFTYIARL